MLSAITRVSGGSEIGDHDDFHENADVVNHENDAHGHGRLVRGVHVERVVDDHGRKLVDHCVGEFGGVTIDDDVVEEVELGHEVVVFGGR